MAEVHEEKYEEKKTTTEGEPCSHNMNEKQSKWFLGLGIGTIALGIGAGLIYLFTKNNNVEEKGEEVLEFIARKLTGR